MLDLQNNFNGRLECSHKFSFVALSYWSRLHHENYQLAYK